jgi:hypothetical protein
MDDLGEKGVDECRLDDGAPLSFKSILAKVGFELVGGDNGRGA